jgi:hypothetical protein
MPTAPISDSGGVELAQNLYEILGEDFNLPAIDLSGTDYELPDATGELYSSVNKLTNDDLTTGVVGGPGTFDVVMESMKAHLKEEYDRGRITGAEYSKTYISLTTAALSTSTQYLLGRDQAYWSAIMTQLQARRAEIEAVTARVQLAVTKAELQMAYFGAQKSEADFALTKMQLANADGQYELILKQLDQATAQTSMIGKQEEQVVYQTANILPEQKRQTIYQTDFILKSQYETSEYNLDNLLPAQRDGLLKDVATKTYTLASILPAQKILIEEQGEVQRSQTLDTRSDGAIVKGSSGKQKDLYDQQIESYVKDNQYKVAKMFMDAWLTQKTILETLDPPNEIQNPEINAVLQSIREGSNLGT